MDRERTKIIASLIVTIVLFSFGCFVGRLATEKTAETWMFSWSAIGILIIGELVWWRISKRIFRD